MSDRHRVLVTGSSGLVGAAVVELLRPLYATAGLDQHGGPTTTVVADLADRAARRRMLAGAWGVVHLAARHAPHVGAVPDAEFRAVNVEATRALIADAVEAGVRRFVYTSSTSVYGNALVPSGPAAVWVDEHLVPQPRDIYDETKLAAEELVTAAPLSSIVLRIARCFPEPPETTAQHRLSRGVDVADVAAAHALALAHPTVTGIYNVAGPLLFSPSDRPELWSAPASLIRRRHPEIAGVFDRNGWALPVHIDRVYDSRSAGLALGYAPRSGVGEVDPGPATR